MTFEQPSDGTIEAGKEVDPAGVLEAYEEFRRIQIEFNRAKERYNEAATKCTTAMGIELGEAQKAKFPDNLRFPSEDMRKRVSELRHARRVADGRKDEAVAEKDLPPELL